MKIKLVVPTLEHKEKALAFKQSFFDYGEDTIDGSELLDRKDCYEEWLAFVSDNACKETIREGSVLTDTYFVVDEQDEIIGIIDYRHELNDFFKDFGHTGYSVLPSKRRQGYATRMLALVKEHAKETGATHMNLSALRTNIPSIKTITNNGGKLVRSFDFYGQIADVFEIEL